MVKFVSINDDTGKKIVCLGLTYENLENLREGNALALNLGDIFKGEITLSQLTNDDEIFIFADESEEKILTLLHEKFNVNVNIKDFEIH